MTFRPVLLFSPALALWAAGCPRSETCGELGEATLELGVGEYKFEAFPEDGALTYVQGTQGGHHVFISLRATGIVPGYGVSAGPENRPVVSLYIEQDGIDVGGYHELIHAFWPGPKKTVQLEGQQVIILVSDPAELEGVPLELHAEVTDICGTYLEASAAITLQPE